MRKLLALIAYAISTFAIAGNWQLGFFADDCSAIFYDLDGVTRPKEGIIHAWEAMVLSRDGETSSGESFDLLLLLLEIDVKNRRSRDLQMNLYKGDTHRLTQPMNDNWRYAVPNTNAYETFVRIENNRKSSLGQVQGTFADLVKYGKSQVENCRLNKNRVKENNKKQ